MRPWIGTTHPWPGNQPIPERPTPPYGGGTRRLASPSHSPVEVSRGEMPFLSRQSRLPKRTRRILERQPREGLDHYCRQGHLVLLTERHHRSPRRVRERLAELGRSDPFVTTLREPSRLERL